MGWWIFNKILLLKREKLVPALHSTAAYIKLSGGKWLMSHGGNDGGPWSRNLGIQPNASMLLLLCFLSSSISTEFFSLMKPSGWRKESWKHRQMSSFFKDWKMTTVFSKCAYRLPSSLWRIGDICWNKENLFIATFSRCLKITQNVTLDFFNLAFSTNFCPIKIDLFGNTFWPQAAGF